MQASGRFWKPSPRRCPFPRCPSLNAQESGARSFPGPSRRPPRPPAPARPLPRHTALSSKKPNQQKSPSFSPRLFLFSSFSSSLLPSSLTLADLLPSSPQLFLGPVSRRFTHFPWCQMPDPSPKLLGERGRAYGTRFIAPSAHRREAGPPPGFRPLPASPLSQGLSQGVSPTLSTPQDSTRDRARYSFLPLSTWRTPPVGDGPRLANAREQVLEGVDQGLVLFG